MPVANHPGGARRFGMPLRCRLRRSCRMSSAFTIGWPSKSCAAVRASAASARARPSNGRCGSARWKRSSRRPWRCTTARATTKFRCSRFRPPIIPQFDELMRRMQEIFRPLGVSVSLPSLRINEQLREVGELLTTDRHSGLTLAPEVARDDMREQVGKRITNEDLYAGCRKAFENGFSRVKLYFMCGLPGEREEDLDGIIEMSEHIARLGKEVTGRFATVVANVSNFVPKPQTPYPMERHAAARVFLHGPLAVAEDSAIKMRGDQMPRRGNHACSKAFSAAATAAWARPSSWSSAAAAVSTPGASISIWSAGSKLSPNCNIDVETILHLPCPAPSPLPWDHIAIRQGRGYLETRACGIDSATGRCVRRSGIILVGSVKRSADSPTVLI